MYYSIPFPFRFANSRKSSRNLVAGREAGGSWHEGDGPRRKRGNIELPHQRVSPLTGARRRFARWRAWMVGWKPLLRQADAHTVSPNVPSHLHLPTRPSKSLRLPPPFRSSASEQGTPRNRLHSAALPANQIAHPEILAAFLSRYSLLLD